MAYDWRSTATRAATSTGRRAAVVARDSMPSDWRPTATRTATITGPRPAVRRRGAPIEAVLVAEAVEEFIAMAAEGRVANRSGRPYRPSALRDLRGLLRYHVARDIGDMRLDDVRRGDIQGLLDRLAAHRLSESRIRSVVSAVRALFGYAIERGWVERSPATGLVIPRADEPAWYRDREDVSAGAGGDVADDDPAWSWTDDVGEPWQERPKLRSDGDERTMPLLPERILSLVLRIAVVVFILFALVTVIESA
jgi:hypothetical protein